MSFQACFGRIVRSVQELRFVQGMRDLSRERTLSLKRAVKETRTAAWHFRQGGFPQLKLWRWKRAAQRPYTETRAWLPEEGLTRDYPQLQRSWSRANYRAEVSAPASVSRGYRNIFAQGWILAAEDLRPDLPRGWVSTAFGVQWFIYDPDLKVQHKGSPGGEYELLLLGHAADSAKRLNDSRQVAIELFEALRTGGGQWTALDEAATWLGGRFLVIARIGNSVRVHVDATASRSCYWGEADAGGIVLSSHSALIGQAVGDQSAEKAKWVLSHPDYSNPAGVYLPGTITASDRAQLVFANCCLTVDDGQVEHARFFPPAGEDVVPPLSVEGATEKFLSEVRFQMDAALSLNPESILSLTAGSDSRAVLHACMDLLQKAGTTAMTYHFFERNADHTTKDLLGANRLAEHAGLQHRILDVQPWNPASRFAKLYHRTFPVWARFAALARTCYEGMSAEESLIIGVGGEVGTAFYLERDFDQVSPQVLAGKFTQEKFRKDPRLIAEFERYMNYTQLESSSAGGIDLLDLFYWEHRLSGWAAYWYSEVDFGPTVVLPLNSRRVFCAMLAVPYEDRVKKSIYRALESWVNNAE